MHPDLAQAAADLGIQDQVPMLTKADAWSVGTIDQARAWLRQHVPLHRGRELDVVVHGSYARREATAQSDFDYLVVAHGMPEGDIRVMRDLLRATDGFITEKLSTPDKGGKDKRPGRTGLFGHIASAPDLTERIGLEQDTNVSTTRRLLVLEESVSIYQPEKRERLISATLERYLSDYDEGTKHGVPRFLLNDVSRYWYTLAVDFQAKRWEGNDRGWGLRYLKLLITRKLSYAGTLVSLLLCDEERPATVERLSAEFNKPPLARLAQLNADPRFDQKEALRDSFLIAEGFTAFLADSDLRRKAEDAQDPAALSEGPETGPMRELAENLHLALGQILFESFLADNSRRYLAL